MDQLSFSREDLIKKGNEVTGLDLRKVAKGGTLVVLLGLLGLGLYKILPYLIELAENALYLSLLGIALFIVLGSIVWFSKFIPHIMDVMTKFMWGWIIEMDEFRFQERQIEQAIKDVETMQEEKKKVQAKYEELHKNVEEHQTEEKLARQMAIEAQRNNDDSYYDYELKAERHRSYVEAISPITQDMKFIIDYIGETYTILKRKINNASQDLQINKAIFYSAEAGANALTRAERAALGDQDINKLAEMSRQRIKEKIAYSIGEMKTSMEILSTVAKDENYRDKAKITLAKEKLKALNSSTSQTIEIPLGRFNDIQPVQKFKDIL